MAIGGFDPRGGQQPMAEINMTPFVDVMLVLLVIFILTAPLLTHSLALDLPAAGAPATPEKPQTVTVSIDPQGRLYWNDSPLPDRAALAARLADASRRTPQPELHLRADREVRYREIVGVMDAAREAGITKLGFVTQPADAPAGR